jgi:hypothetical protein
MAAPLNEDWRVIAEQASTETDPDKLTDLVAQLCKALDDQEKLKRGNQVRLAA